MQSRGNDAGGATARGKSPDWTGDVIVVGGGLNGLALTIALAQGGLDVAVVDQAPAATLESVPYDGRTTAVALGPKRMLEALDLWGRFAPDACPIDDIRVSDGPSRLHLHFDHREVGDQPFGWIVENRMLRIGLREAVEAYPNVTVFQPVAVTDAHAHELGHSVTLADGRVLMADLVAAADGKFSPLRRAAGIKVRTKSYGQNAIVFMVRHEKPHRHIAHERFLSPGPLALLPMAGTDDESRGGAHRSSVVWTVEGKDAERALNLPEAAFNATLTERFGPTYGRLEVVGKRWTYPLGRQNAARYVADRLALIGDAAHLIHPIAGQGLNLGLRDAAALAELALPAKRAGEDLGDPRLLKRYADWRRPDVLALIAATDGLNELFRSTLPPVRIARRLGIAAVDAVPPLKKFFMRQAMGLNESFPKLVKGERLV